jgi:hypothetical protein
MGCCLVSNIYCCRHFLFLVSCIIIIIIIVIIIIIIIIITITYRVGRLTRMTGSSSDDWIY